jgi:AcrR family transcriptional regulator
MTVITTPTTDRGRATVGRILDAACELFTRQGVHATTLDDIGIAAGVGRGQLYHFFADKADIVADMASRQVQRVLDEVRSAITDMSTAEDVQRFCDELVSHHSEPDAVIRCPMGALIHQLTDSDEAARAALKAGFAQWETLLAEGLRRVADNGGLIPGADPPVMAVGLLAAYQGGLLLAELSGDVEPLRRALGTVTGLALAPFAPA